MMFINTTVVKCNVTFDRKTFMQSRICILGSKKYIATAPYFNNGVFEVQ